MNERPRKDEYLGPDVGWLSSSYRDCVNNRDSSFWQRQQVNYEARYCVWPYQSWDGKKGRRADKTKVFPWVGASDARVFLVDHYIRVDVAMLMEAWRSQRVQVRSTSPARSGGNANQLTTLLRWQVYEDMEEAEAEAELLANVLLERGAAAVGVFWDRREQMGLETIRMADIELAAAQAARGLMEAPDEPMLRLQAELPRYLLDPELEASVLPLLKSLLELRGARLDNARLRRLLADLRAKGEAGFPVPNVIRDRPTLRTMIWNEDLFMPMGSVDLASTRVVFQRELLTETELTERSRSLGYDPNWVDELIDTRRGRVEATGEESVVETKARPWGRAKREVGDLFEVVTAFRRQYDEDSIPAIYTTVFVPSPRRGRGGRNGANQERHGKHELLDYAHGQMPFVIFQTERRARLVDDARGYGERGHTFQAQVKRQWDLRTDRADTATLPPSYHPPGEEPDAWGPGVSIPTMQPDRFGFFDIPKHDLGSKEVEETVRKFSDEYFGRRLEGSDGVDAGNLRQHLVAGWLRGWKEVFTHVLRLDQQFLPDQVFTRVVGSSQGQSMRVTREEIQGGFNVSLSFSVKHLDMEYLTQMIAMLSQVLQIDASGRVDRDELVQAAFELLDPAWGERLLKPGESASLAQIDAEKDVLVKLLAGIPVDVRGDEAFGLRRQVLMSVIQQSPAVKATLQNNPIAMKLVETRLQQLDFNVQQREVNPEIGRRLGTQPMERAMKEGA